MSWPAPSTTPATLTLVLSLLFCGPRVRAVSIYQADFESPAFSTGNLSGQDGWASSGGVSQNAAAIAAGGWGQAIRMDGALVGLNSPGFYNASFSRALGNYNPVGSGNPIVDVSADLWQVQGASTAQSPWQFAFLAVTDEHGVPFGTIGMDQWGRVFAQNGGSPNQVAGDGGTATNGFHKVKLELNFTNRTITLFEDGFSCGSIIFNPAAGNALGALTLQLQGGAPLDSVLWMDNLTITAGSAITASAFDVQIDSAGPCLADATYGIPHVGDDAYALKAIVRIRGIPAQPFRFKWQLANVTAYSDYLTLPPGDGYWQWYVIPMALDDAIPWSVTIDPDGVSGDTNLVNNTAGGTFTPIPPATVVDLYAPRLLRGSEVSMLSFGPGTLPNLWVTFGVPTTHGGQRVISLDRPPNAQVLPTQPYDTPVLEVARTNVSGGSFFDTNRFAVQVNRVRVNPTLLRAATWAEIEAMPPAWKQWLAPDTLCQSTNAAIAAFVQQSLPANYRASLTPYDTARTLHCAVAKRLFYLTPPLHDDAVGSLQDGSGDCGCFAALLTASLRSVGIPARRISGFREGDTAWHIRVEFHLPGVEWLVADPTDDNALDPSGTYAYCFGYVPNADGFVAVDVGDAHVLANAEYVNLQTPNFLWNGGAPLTSRTCLTTLEGVPTLWPTGVLGGEFHIYMSDVPASGSVVFEESTNLLSWSPALTNSAAGKPMTHSFSHSTSSCGFYRARIVSD